MDTMDTMDMVCEKEKGYKKLHIKKRIILIVIPQYSLGFFL